MRKTETSKRLPASLAALRTFEAAARLESLTRAAQELGVGVSAVAFQVRQVEQALGVKLLVRRGRYLEASPEGARLAAELRIGFEAIEAAIARVAERPPAEIVTVSMLPSFAALWLLPRLARFRAAAPEIDLRLSTAERLVDLGPDGIDCAIRCGPGGWAGVEATPLFPQRLAPLCHWSWRPSSRPLRPENLPDEAIIVNSVHPEEWEEWFAAAGIARAAPARAQSIRGRELVYEAVVAGLGAGLLDISVLDRELASGDLVQLFPEVLETGWNHCLVLPAGRPPSAGCSAFAQWLLSEAG